MKENLGFMSSSSSRIAWSWRRVALPCLLAIILRLILIGYTPTEGPVDLSVCGDGCVYHETASRLAHDANAWFVQGSNFGYRAPLYFAFLAMIYKVTGHQTYHVGQFANLSLLVITMFLLYKITETSFGIKVATITVWLRAIFPTFVVSDVSLMTESLFDVWLLAILMILLAHRSGAYRARDLFILGLFIGAALLTRESAQGLVIILLGVLVFETHGLRAKLVCMSLMLLGLGVLLIPWMWRNTLVWQSPFPLALTSGVNLHIGNHPDATGAHVAITQPSYIKIRTREFDRWHRDQAIQYILEAPGRFLLSGIKKLGWLVWPNTLRDEIITRNFFPMLPWFFRVAIVAGSSLAWAAVWLLGLVGLTTRSLDRYGWAVILLLAYTCIVVFIAIGEPRFAQPIILLLLAPTARVMVEFKSVASTLRRPCLRAASAWGAVSLVGVLWAIILAEKLF
jgi:4-amino-4-deoxy-L-arabinose transferase-like glycosyltransferase